MHFENESFKMFKELLMKKGINLDKVSITTFKEKQKLLDLAFDDYFAQIPQFIELQSKSFNIHTVYENFDIISQDDTHNIYTDAVLIKNHQLNVLNIIHDSDFNKDKSELILILNELTNIMLKFKSKKQYIESFNILKKKIDKHKGYKHLSRLAEISSRYRIVINSTVDSNVRDAYNISDYFTLLCILGMLKDDKIHTGFFVIDNKFTRINKILNDNYKTLKSKRQIPQWITKKIDKIDGNIKIPVFHYFLLLTNMFYFYDVVSYKHTRDLFDKYFENHCKHHILQTHIAQTTDVSHLQRDIGNKIGLNIGEIQALINNKKQIFCKTHINSYVGNVLYVTEYIKKKGRVLFVSGKDKTIGQYFIYINLMDLFTSETIRIYTSLLDWELDMYSRDINFLLLDVIFSVLYVGLEDNKNEKTRSRLKDIFEDVTPFIITKEHLKEKRFKDIELLVSDINAFPPSLRRLPKGWSPSEQALQLAEEYNWEIPDGYTFVREFEKRVYKKND